MDIEKSSGFFSFIILLPLAVTQMKNIKNASDMSNNDDRVNYGDENGHIYTTLRRLALLGENGMNGM